MKLTVKQFLRKDKKSEGMAKTIYSCSLEGYDLGAHDYVYASVTLESQSQEDLKKIVRQEIDTEVDIIFTVAQRTLDEFETKLKKEYDEKVESEADKVKFLQTSCMPIFCKEVN